MEPGIYIGEYKGKEILGFTNKHKYQFELKHNGRSYQLHAFLDITEDEEVDLYSDYSSSISIKQNWNIVNDEK